MLILGLNGWHAGGHDASASLVEAGKSECRILAAVEEEKVSARKNAFDRLPLMAIKEVLSISGRTAKEVDAVVFGWDYPEAYRAVGAPYPYTSSAELLSTLGLSDAQCDEVHFIRHHLAHASSAYRTAPKEYRRAATVVIDGCGETESMTAWSADAGENLTCLKSEDWCASLGFLYEATNLLVGFRTWESGKTMGLAAYGSPKYTESIHSFTRLGDRRGQFERAARLVQRLSPALTPLMRNQDVSVKSWLYVFEEIHGWKRTETAMSSFVTCGTHLQDYAASTQAVVERDVAEFMQEADLIETARAHGLCLAGGVALNCAMNGKLAEQFELSELYVHPAANDAGVSLGAALEWAHQNGLESRADFTPFLGREHSTESILDTLNQAGVRYRLSDNGAEEIADIIDSGGTVGVFQGRNEWGPRALGARSIIAKPRSGLLDHINHNVKLREGGRPLGPAMLRDDQGRLWDGPGVAGQYMTIARRACADAGSYPGVVHVDGTFRPQVVAGDGDVPQQYADQLHAIRSRTGSSIVVNTSLNGVTPIVYHPEHALAFAADRKLDTLVFNGSVFVDGLGR